MTPARSVAVIVNPVATRVDDGLRTRLRQALAGAEVTELVTSAPGQAAGLAREAADAGSEVVVAVGGDGHAADILGALIGTGVATAIVPGGNANVIARGLGWPARPGLAIDRLAAAIAADRRRTVRFGRVEAPGVSRVFGLNAGVGLDAEAVTRVEERPAMKHRLRHAAFVIAGAQAGFDLARRPPRLELETDGAAHPTVASLLVACGHPYAYLAGRALDLLPTTDFTGQLAWLALTRTRPRDLVGVGIGIVVRGRVPAGATERGVARTITVRSAAPVAVQADGEPLGRHTTISFTSTDPTEILDPRFPQV